MPTWKVGVDFPEALIPAGPLMTQVLEASLQIEVVPENRCILRSVSSIATSDDLILHIV